uniref:NADH-ubiquinone oxidoreductase chain 3 n=1 Tax=Scydmaeninae sp. 840218 TaxID=1213605 RepID=A0A0S2MP86_9COLE|nr:NADH deshydrogenase subunit 3 [Scydmaeninae sp. 840218]
MNMIMVLMMCILVITSFLLILMKMIMKKSFNDREKNSPFECGFDPKSYARMPFSIQFFLIALIFLIFDIEITILIPMILIKKMSSIYSFMITNMMFIIILIIGLLHEWKQMALNWPQ